MSILRVISLSLFLLALPNLLSGANVHYHKNYSYFQLNQAFNLNSSVNTFSSTTSEDGIVTNTETSVSFRPLDANYLSNFLVGYHFADGHSIEIEGASYDLYGYKMNDELTSNEDFTQTTYRYDYFMFNYKKEFAYFDRYAIYYKAGFGGLKPNLVNIISGGSDAGGFNIDPALQLALGFSYAFNDMFHIDSYYKLLANYGRKREIFAAGGSTYKFNAIEGTLNISLRYNIYYNPFS